MCGVDEVLGAGGDRGLHRDAVRLGVGRAGDDQHPAGVRERGGESVRLGEVTPADLHASVTVEKIAGTVQDKLNKE